MPLNEPFAVPVHPVQLHPVSLLGDDLIIRDPDAPEREVHWQLTKVTHGSDVLFGVVVGELVVVEYVTEDGTEGCHGFEDPGALVIVAARTGAPVVA